MSNVNNEENFNLNRVMFRLKVAGLTSSAIAHAFDLSTQQVAGFLAAYTRKLNLASRTKTRTVSK